MGGMLENGPLLLRDCAAPPGVAAGAAAALRPARAVLDALTGAPLGFAGWRRGGAWPRWLARPVLAVHESDDAPLVFTVHRLWALSERWEVREADGHAIGLLCGALIKDRYGRNIALWQRPAGGLGRARDGDGQELMSVLTTPEGTRVAFAAAAERNPFLKMLLLAAALVDAG